MTVINRQQQFADDRIQRLAAIKMTYRYYFRALAGSLLVLMVVGSPNKIWADLVITNFSQFVLADAGTPEIENPGWPISTDLSAFDDNLGPGLIASAVQDFDSTATDVSSLLPGSGTFLFMSAIGANSFSVSAEAASFGPPVVANSFMHLEFQVTAPVDFAYSFSQNSVVGADPAYGFLLSGLFDGPLVQLGSNEVDQTGSGLITLSTSETYTLDITATANLFAPGDESVDLDFWFSITNASIPEPTSGMLFGMACLAMFVRRKR